jgi:two-component system response regulator AtoC
LDEIGNLPIDLQGKLLRVLQDGEYLKLGSSSQQTVDVRFIAASNEDLDKMMAKKAFRKDLYYRIRGGWLHLPSLNERKEDIPLLVDKFLQDFMTHPEKSIIEEETMCLLMEYEYPGNIRDLRKRPSISTCLIQPMSEDIAPLEHIEKSHIIRAYKLTGRNKSQTARLLGIGLNTLRRKLKSYGVE